MVTSPIKQYKSTALSDNNNKLNLKIAFNNSSSNKHISTDGKKKIVTKTITRNDLMESSSRKRKQSSNVSIEKQLCQVTKSFQKETCLNDFRDKMAYLRLRDQQVTEGTDIVPLYYEYEKNELFPDSFHDFESQGLSLPASFNPRATKNMPSVEKVTKWMERVPIYLVNENVWESMCLQNVNSYDWEEKEFDFDSKIISYGIDEFASAVSLSTQDDIIEFQKQRWDALVIKTYELEEQRY